MDGDYIIVGEGETSEPLKWKEIQKLDLNLET